MIFKITADERVTFEVARNTNLSTLGEFVCGRIVKKIGCKLMERGLVSFVDTPIAETHEYKVMGAIYVSSNPEFDMAAIEKQHPLEPIWGKDEQDYVKCPTCEYIIGHADNIDYFCKPKYCEECGQKLKWKVE